VVGEKGLVGGSSSVIVGIDGVARVERASGWFRFLIVKMRVPTASTYSRFEPSCVDVGAE
jgi:hypothetical protein